MPAYVIAYARNARDPEALAEYRRRNTEVVEAHGGRFLARGGDQVILEGEPAVDRVVIMEFPDLDAAEREAAVSAASIGRDLLPKGDAREVTVEVRNEHRQRILTVTVSMHLDRVHPSPEPPRA